MAYYYNQDFMNDVVGKGMSVTDTFEVGDHDLLGKTKVVSGFEKINESIRMILSTREGERAFLPEFGSKLYTTIFEQNDYIFADLVELYTREALSTWEKRIVVDSVQVQSETDGNIVPVVIMYHLANSNVSGSYIYPFNISEDGTTDIYQYDTSSKNINRQVF